MEEVLWKARLVKIHHENINESFLPKDASFCIRVVYASSSAARPLSFATC